MTDLQTAEGKIEKNNQALLSANAQAAKDRASLKDLETEIRGVRQTFEQEKSLLESKVMLRPRDNRSRAGGLVATGLLW